MRQHFLWVSLTHQLLALPAVASVPHWLTASFLSLGFTLPLPQRSLNRLPKESWVPSPVASIQPPIQQEWGKDHIWVSSSLAHLRSPWVGCRLRNSRMLNNLFTGVWQSITLWGVGGVKNSHRRMWSPSISFIYDDNMGLMNHRMTEVPGAGHHPAWFAVVVEGAPCRLRNTLYVSFCF